MKRFKTLKVTSHTDFVGKGSTFVALQGQNESGCKFIETAIEKSATKIVVSKDAQLTSKIVKLVEQSAELKLVENPRIELAKLSAAAYKFPASKLKIVATTGTKGKTTTTFLLNQIFSEAGFKTGMITGVYNQILTEKYEPNLTTPNSDYLHRFFFECVKKGVEYIFMEASAHAFTLNRLYGIEFVGAIFTNLDLEHLEFYKDMNEYFQAKLEILNHLKPGAPIIVNIDNLWGRKLFEQSAKCVSFSSANRANYRIDSIKNLKNKLSFLLEGPNLKEKVESNLVGNFNAYNIGMASALANELGIPNKRLQANSFIPGRMETLKLFNGATAVVDYAHNPSSYEAVLPTLKSLTKKLIVVFGAGGSRDASRRPTMGKIASEWADIIILTSDNPRNEDPNKILDDIKSGVPTERHNKIQIELDREKAIQLAVSLSDKNSLVAVLGKGPDEYQIIGEKKNYFSDKECLLAYLHKF